MGVSKEWEKALLVSNSKAEATITKSMNIIYLQAKEHLAAKKFASLKNLCIDLGCEDLKNCQEVDKHTSYESYESIRDMEYAMSSVITDKLLSNLQKCTWYSVCIDEASDCSTKQCMIVYVKYVDVLAGDVHTDFLKLHELPGCTAKDIYDALIVVLHEHGLSEKQLAGISTDGASVMTGFYGGVTALLKKEVPHVISVHCIAHRLALASAQAADKLAELFKYQEVLNRIFKYFYQSGKRTRLLQSFQDILDMAERKFVRVSSTRWLSLNRCVDAVLKSWSALVSVLLEDTSAVGQGLLKAVACYKFVAISAYLSDILFLLSKLCQVFQRKDIDFEVCEIQVSTTIQQLNALKNTAGPTFKDFEQKAPRQVSESGEFEFEGHFIKDTEKGRDAVNKVKLSFIGNLLDNLNGRFADIGKLKYFTTLLPRNIPSVDSDKFSEYGETDIIEIYMMLQSHFQSEGIDKNNVLMEWGMFKRVLKIRCADMSLSKAYKFLVRNDLLCEYPAMSTVCEFTLSLPIHTVDCERGFSDMNLTKTDIRNRLAVSNVSHLMNISINGPERRDFNFKDAYLAWCTHRQRRIQSKYD